MFHGKTGLEPTQTDTLEKQTNKKSSFGFSGSQGGYSQGLYQPFLSMLPVLQKVINFVQSHGKFSDFNIVLFIL